MNIKNLSIAILATVCAMLIYVNFYYASNVEDCVLKKMKGQSDKLLPIAARLCKKEFAKNTIDPFDN